MDKIPEWRIHPAPGFMPDFQYSGGHTSRSAVAFMRVVAAALSRSDPSGDELIYDGINLPANPQIHFDIVRAEEVHRFGTHPADHHVRNLMLGEQGW